MTSETQTSSDSNLSSEDVADMMKFGISKVSVDYFYFGKYRYTELKDAIAQAKRQTRSS